MEEIERATKITRHADVLAARGGGGDTAEIRMDEWRDEKQVYCREPVK